MNRKSLTENCKTWIKEYFKKTGACNAVIDISGHKNSTVIAKLCCEAIGKEHVVGVMFLNGMQISSSRLKDICRYLEVRSLTLDVSSIDNDFRRCIYNSGDSFPELPEQMKADLIPRIKMTALYGIAQTLNAKVSCNVNLDENLIGFTTLYGNLAGDFAPILRMHTSKVIEIGTDLGIPQKFLYSGKNDEQELGFSYSEVESMYEKFISINSHEFTAAEQCAYDRMMNSAWKRKLINIPSF